MAITIQASPDKFTPAFNPVHFRISSNNYLQPDFKFVADVYNGTGQLLATLKYQPQVIGSQPIDIDINRVLHELVAPNYCRANDTMGVDIVTTAAGALAGYSVQFGEQYGGVLHGNLNSFSGYAFNGALNNKRFAFYSQAAYLNKQFLTGFNRQVARKRDSIIITMLQSDTAAIPAFSLSIFDITGTMLHSGSIPNPYNSTTITNNRALHLHVGFDHLFASLSFPVVAYNNAAYYTITAPSGNTMRIDLYSQCERFPGVRLYFLNQYGGFDAFNFMLADRWEQTNEKKSYQRQPSDKRTGYDPVTRRFEATTRNYYTKYTEKRKLVSDYLTDQEAELLGGLMYAPLVYMEVPAAEYGGPNGPMVLVPVDVKLQDYTIKKTRVDKMFNLELDVELTTTNFAQGL
ncbi:hypothetical protein [Chitinophaga sp. HK235]|uniref:hypothetical protein n=1 Tax=Chitinophaga sp. HK235 TaxID=2952571 RepID=UPI001BA8FFC1|nr:hypothetical protein [Chitinophaga sp. HK235]